MRKFSLVGLVLLLVGLIAYGQESGWREDGSNVKLRQSSDKVGIGTSTPSAKLDIANVGKTDNVSILVMSEDGNDEFVFKGDFAGAGATGNRLKLDTYWGNNVMTWRGDGNVGIGVINPEDKLAVNGYVTLGGGIANSHFPWRGNGWAYVSGKGIIFRRDNAGGHAEFMRIHDNGCVGIGRNRPSYKLDVNGVVNMTGFKMATGASTGYVLKSDANGVGTWKAFTHRWSMNPNSELYYNGNVGIKTSNPESELAVNGKITTREIEVTANGWPDFVFEDGYKLTPLSELKNHIKENKHLPGIPTEKEAEENGVNLGDMQAKLLEKVEELTLYAIEQNEKLIELQKKNEELQSRINTLETK